MLTKLGKSSILFAARIAKATMRLAKHKRLIGGQMMLLKTILESVMWSPKVRSGVAYVSPETPTTVIADLIARAINELAALRQPTSWVNKKTTIHASYDKENGFIDVSLTR